MNRFARYDRHERVAVKQMALRDRNDLRHQPPKDWLVPGRIARGTSGVIFGKGGCFKSQTALDLALSLATPVTHWLGLPVPTCPVLYVATEEGPEVLNERIDVWEHVHQIRVPRGMFVVEDELVDFNDPDCFADLADRTRAAGLSPGLLIYDTVAQCMNGADENMPAVVAPILKRARIAAARFGATTMFVHHPAQWNGKPRPRGAGNWVNDTDWTYHFRREGQSERFHIECQKLRNSTVPPNLTLRAPLVTLPHCTGVRIEKVEERAARTPAPAAPAAPAPTCPDVLETLRREFGEQPFRFNAGFEKVGGGKGRYTEALAKGTAKGVIEKTAEGAYRFR